MFFDPRWKQDDSPITKFEIHKMRYASRLGPHSSACARFVDKKRDHLRKAVPEKCEICGEAIRPPLETASTTCRNCKTRYIKFRGKVRVMTAYEHEYNRFYHAITGGDASADLEAWKRELRTRLPAIVQGGTEIEDLDALAEEAEAREEPPRVWPQFNPALQAQVDRLMETSDIPRLLSVAMARSAINATRRIITLARLHTNDVGQAIANQEKVLAQIDAANPTKLLAYEALVMKEYWRCYGLALRRAQQWFGPRKRSRFVMEFVEDPAGRARGYSPVDAAINYLHQRRLRQAERINAEVGFPGTCDGFLHRERYNSRGIGLLLDTIDPFKFADREELLVVALNGGISWMDFRLERDRRGLTFYYPSENGDMKLDQVGADADEALMAHGDYQISLKEGFRKASADLLRALDSTVHSPARLEPFVFNPVDAK